jgi:hypothetical protein
LNTAPRPMFAPHTGQAFVSRKAPLQPVLPIIPAARDARERTPARSEQL